MQRFAVIGHPVAHSLSPAMHAANFRALGFDGRYETADVGPRDLPAAVRRFAAGGFRGINCTVPHKEAVVPLVTRLDETARKTGAVNTVRFEGDGSATGFNTDVSGFRASLKAAHAACAGRRVLILGAGGAARAVAVACQEEGAGRITLANRTVEKAQRIARDLEGLSGTVPVAACALGAAPVAGADVIVNATSVGLRADDPSVLAGWALRPDQTVCDIIPVRRETATLLQARRAGCLALGGLGMLVAQGAESFRIWTGLEPDLAAMTQALTGDAQS